MVSSNLGLKKNMDKLTNYCINKGLSHNLNSVIVGFLVFGGKDPLTKCSGYENTFISGFSRIKSLEV